MGQSIRPINEAFKKEYGNMNEFKKKNPNGLNTKPV